MIQYVHDGSMGDIIYSLPAIQAFGSGELWILKAYQFSFLQRLLLAASCIEGVHPGYPSLNGTEFVDLRKYRQVTNEAVRAKIPKHLAQCHLDVVGKEFDLTQPWLGVPGIRVARIIINRTYRYHGNLNWPLLRHYEGDVAFIGTDQEYRRMQGWLGIEVMHVHVQDAMDMARVIAGSELFVGNQSLAFSIAEAMKHPRVLEVCKEFRNCGPIGPWGYKELTREVIEAHVC